MNTPCQICGEPSTGVLNSACGPVSIAYCAECATNHREPWGLMVACCSMLNRGEVAEWLKPYIKGTLDFYGRTEDELWTEADTALAEYCAHGRG